MSSVKIHREDMDKEQGAFVEPLLGKTGKEAEVSPEVKSGVMEVTKKYKSTFDISSSEDLVCINLAGKKFFVLLRNFVNLPTSRLAKMVQAEDPKEIETYCSKFIAGTVPEYFFDRSGKGFNDILDVYRTGKLHINKAGTCPMLLKRELEFWEIDELTLDPCCALKYYPEVEICEKEIDGQTTSENKFLLRLKAEDFGQERLGRIRKQLWNLTEYPETSLAARCFAFTSITVVIISTLTFILSTLPELTENIDMILFDNKTGNDSTGSVQWEEGIIALRVVDELTMWFFTIEYIVRFVCAPKKWEFVKGPLNIVDILAILPYFLSFAVEEVKDTMVVGRAGKVLRLVRVMRILRVFKLVRHFAGLQSLLFTLQQAYQELGLLMILVWVSVLTCSSLVYFAEKDAVEKWSFLDSFWWGLMVLTTVGSGSTAPSTALGKMIGGFCAVLGVFILALPVPIVLQSFSQNYKNRLWRNEVMSKKKDKIEQDTLQSCVKNGNGL